MATISNSARISGLASGLDIETIVDGLTQGTQTKINEAKKDLQVLEWKKEAYQSITDALFAFQNTYCGTANSSMFAVSDLKKLAASSSSNYVAVTATDNSTPLDVYISDIVSLASAAKVKSSGPVSAPLTLAADTDALSALAGKSMLVTLDGTTKTLTFGAGPYGTVQEAADELQSLLDGAFGAGRAAVSVDGDTLTLDGGSGILVLSNTGVAGSEASDILGFSSGDSNRLMLRASISFGGLALNPGDAFSFSINGVDFSFTSNSSVQNIMDAINSSQAGVKMSYSKTTDAFTLVSNETGSASAIALADTEGSFLASILGYDGGTGSYGSLTAGTDAVLTVGMNGETDAGSLVTLTRSSNTFEIDGTTFTLKGKAAGDAPEGVTVTVGVDAQAAAEKITEFIGAYNKLLDTVTDKLYETVYKGYRPLSDDQKENMTDREIEAWTEKAKSGLLNGDSALSALYSQLRNAMLNAVQDADGNSLGMSLASIGIKAQSYTAKGQLSVDASKLLAALQSDPDAVMALLTQTSDVTYSHYLTSARATERYQTSGLLWRVSDIVKNSLSTVGNTGRLADLVGSPAKEYKGTTDFSKKIKAAEDKLDTLLDRLNDEEDAYWKKYTALETAMSQLNSMSGFLSSMLSV
ncbi:MAG TPA: flagellar filament capping protein FliD [Terriglobales bacterium]|nr:flagellar filament capping protein FliD [Terriglobales bacterium]